MLETIRTFVEQLPRIISEAAKSALGIIALMILALSVLSLILFNQAPDNIKVMIYILTVISFLLFVGVLLRVAAPISSSQQDIKEPKSGGTNPYHHISVVVHHEDGETMGIEGATVTLFISPEPLERKSDEKGNAIFFFPSSLDGKEAKLNARKHGYQITKPMVITLMDGGLFFFAIKPEHEPVQSSTVPDASPSRHLLPEYNVRKAQEYARDGRIEEWVHKYLNRPQMGAKPGFSIGLKRRKRWWNGPLEMKLEELNRNFGPELYMPYKSDPFVWTKLITELVECCKDPLDVPPLIVECERDLNLNIRHGDAWFEAMRWKGWQTCWVIIWYNTESDYRRHTKRLTKSGYLRGQDQN